MTPLLQHASISSLTAVVGLAGAQRLAGQFEQRLLPTLDQIANLSAAEVQLAVHSLRGSALLLGMSALAEQLLAVEEGQDWRAHEQLVRDIAARSIAALRSVLDEQP